MANPKKEIIFSMMNYKGYYIPKTHCYELYNPHNVLLARYHLNDDSKEILESVGMDKVFIKTFDDFLRKEGVIL